MGLIRKSLSIATLGIVRGSSKKQRLAKKNLKINKKIAKNTAETNKILEAQTQQEGATVQTNQADNLTQLERLAELKSKGVITQEEFDQQKAKLLE
jgi:multidrug resistance efflux pump